MLPLLARGREGPPGFAKFLEHAGASDRDLRHISKSNKALCENSFGVANSSELGLQPRQPEPEVQFGRIDFERFLAKLFGAPEIVKVLVETRECVHGPHGRWALRDQRSKPIDGRFDVALTEVFVCKFDACPLPSCERRKCRSESLTRARHVAVQASYLAEHQLTAAPGFVPVDRRHEHAEAIFLSSGGEQLACVFNSRPFVDLIYLRGLCKIDERVITIAPPDSDIGLAD
jgi:hypothetical protein